MKVALLVACSMSVGSACMANEFLCDSATSRMGHANPGYYIAEDAMLSAWRPLKRAERLPNTPQSIVYIRSGQHSGAIVVKTMRSMTNGNAAATHVQLRRSSDLPQCDIGLSTRVLWWLFPIGYDQGQPVTVDDYVKYHRDRTPKGEIDRFHIKYVGRADACIATNDSSNGNRAQFLYGAERSLSDPSLVLAGRVRIVTPTFARTDLADAEYAETLIATYPKTGCTGFQFRPTGAGTYRLRINDLERRTNDGMRVKKEKSISIVVQ